MLGQGDSRESFSLSLLPSTLLPSTLKCDDEQEETPLFCLSNMVIWEADFYRRPLQDEAGQPLWELLLCDAAGKFGFSAFCPQAQASASWLVTQLQQAATEGQGLPDRIRAFRPQTLNLLESACQVLEIEAEPSRQTPALKQWLLERASQYPLLGNFTGQPYNPLQLEQPAPVPLPENLWGEQWRFASLPAGELVDSFAGRMIPILEMPEPLLPINLGLASTTPIPGVMIDGGRRAMPLARWLQGARPASLNFIAGPPDGLILEAGLVDRWVVATFADPDVAEAARTFEQRKQTAKGLHFLLVRPDDSGMTFSGFWLLQS